MRKISLALAAFASLLAISCQVEKPVLPEESGLTITSFSASFDGDGDETRTVRQSSGKVYWNPGDRLSVFTEAGTDGGACFTSTNTAPKARVDFTGNLSRPNMSTYYYAYYPYSSSVSFDGTAFQATLPAEQESEEGGTFADDLFISMGRTRTSSMSFYHLTGGVKFTVTQMGIKSVTLMGFGGEILAGEVLADLGNDAVTPTVRKVIEGSESVTLTAAPRSTFTPGIAYHIVTLPVNFKDGFKLIFEKTDGSIAVKAVTRSVDIQRAHFAVLNDADKGLSFETDYFELDPFEVSLSSFSKEFKLYVRASEEPHIDVFDSWITFVRREGDYRTGAYYVFRADRNVDPEEREGYISVCSNTTCYMATVTQAGFREGEWMEAGFTHHSFGMRFTATWCGYCPMMNDAFKMVREEIGDKFLYACFYSSSSGGKYGFSQLSALESQYGITGYPTGLVDGRAEIGNLSQVEATARNIVAAVNQTEANYPTVTGIAMDSSVSGDKLSLEVIVFPKVSDTYKLTVLVLENNIIGPQKDYVLNVEHTDFVHNKVARAALTNVTGNTFQGVAGKEQSFSYTYTIPAEYNKENLEIVAYVQRPFGAQTVISTGNYGGFYVDNARAAAVGTSADPEFE